MTPRVGIIVGSDSDLSLMEAAARVLEDFRVPYEATIASAHRSPDKAITWARRARERGLQVIVAAAGMAAHLPGVLAAHTDLPVIGVPVASGALGGIDALYSMTEMPPGVPVATVGIGNARNAALLAIRILAVSDGGLAKRLDAYAEKMAEGVQHKDKVLQEKGIHAYREGASS